MSIGASCTARLSGGGLSNPRGWALETPWSLQHLLSPIVFNSQNIVCIFSCLGQLCFRPELDPGPVRWWRKTSEDKDKKLQDN